jgi:cytokinin dehydrogenase
MDVVTGRGEKVTCSAASNSDLFDAVRAGLGQVGVITRATLRLVAAPRQVRRFLLFYPDLGAMVDNARLLAANDRFDAVKGAVLGTPTGEWTFQLDVAKTFTGAPPDDDALLADLSDDPGQRLPTTLVYLDYLRRVAALEAALRANGQWSYPHPWLATFVGDAAVESVVGAELDRLNPATDLGRFGQVVLSPIRRRAVTSPLLRLPSDELCHAFNLLRIPTTDDAATAVRLVEANEAVYRRVKDAGGTLYPVSAFRMSPGDWREHFGSVFGLLRDAKRKFDPDVIMTPGYEIFS